MRNEEELMARTRAGDRDAFETLAETYWPVARQTAYGILRDEWLSEDVAQECFADLYMQRERYKPQFSFRAYVSAIARHKSLDLLRRRGRRAPRDTEQEEAGSAESEYIRGLYLRAMYAAVERFPLRKRRMLTAYALDGESYKQIADELGITVAQVKITLHRMRRTLRRVKEEWEE